VQEISINTWEEFPAQLRMLDERRAALRDMPKGSVSRLLFRGQADARWQLETTLERYSGINQLVSVVDYYKLVTAVRPQVESFTDRVWNIPDYTEYLELLRKDEFFPLAGFSGYEFLVYLRHHGFPSPLLDWTRSPYIAAYFAFGDGPLSTERVALYAYYEFAGRAKTGWAEAPRITRLGAYVRTHPRHFLQQSEYTVCTVRDRTEWHFARHENVFGRADGRQDVLWKLTLPSAEAPKVLADLERFNINAYSLFGSEDSLLRTLAMRELFLRARTS